MLIKGKALKCLEPLLSDVLLQHTLLCSPLYMTQSETTYGSKRKCSVKKMQLIISIIIALVKILVSIICIS